MYNCFGIECQVITGSQSDRLKDSSTHFTIFSPRSLALPNFPLLQKCQVKQQCYTLTSLPQGNQAFYYHSDEQIICQLFKSKKKKFFWISTDLFMSHLFPPLF